MGTRTRKCPHSNHFQKDNWKGQRYLRDTLLWLSKIINANCFCSCVLLVQPLFFSTWGKKKPPLPNVRNSAKPFLSRKFVSDGKLPRREKMCYVFPPEKMCQDTQQWKLWCHKVHSYLSQVCLSTVRGASVTVSETTVFLSFPKDTGTFNFWFASNYNFN